MKERFYEYLVRFGSWFDAHRPLPDEGIADVRIGDFSYRLLVPLSPGAGRDVYLHHIREPFSSFTYLNTLRHFRYFTLYEIGANVGYYLVSGASLATRVHAYEPQEPLHRYLNFNLLLNFIPQRVDLHAAAIWPGGGTVSMTSPDKHNLSRVSSDGTVSVPAVDPYDLPEPSGPSVLRMDIEGAESEVLLPLVDHLSPDYVFVEHHPNIVGIRETHRLFDELLDVYYPLFFFEPLPETIGLPLHDLAWRWANVGPQMSPDDYIDDLYRAASRGWVVHVHWYRSKDLWRSVWLESPWNAAWRL